MTVKAVRQIKGYCPELWGYSVWSGAFSINNMKIVDISKEIVEMSTIVFPDSRENPVYDPRVNVHIEDGRFFLLTTNKKFDLITKGDRKAGQSGFSQSLRFFQA